MHTTITYEFEFQAAHQLHWHPGACSSLHGHTYRCELTFAGELDEHGIIVDFDEVAKVVEHEVMPQVDHTFLNNWIANPTAENLAAALFGLIDTADLPLQSLRLWETRTSSAIVTRE